MNVSDYHLSPLPESDTVNPLAVTFALFFIVGLGFALLYLWLSD